MIVKTTIIRMAQNIDIAIFAFIFILIPIQLINKGKIITIENSYIIIQKAIVINLSLNTFSTAIYGC